MSKNKFVCPVCETDFDKVEKWGKDGDVCPRCHVPLVVQRKEGKDKDNPEIVYLLDENKLDAEGFVRVTFPDSNPTIKRRVGNKGTIDFVVIYEGTVGNGRMACPACGGYLGQLQVFPGTTPETRIDAPRCQKTLREEVDGRDGKCRKQTRFIYRHNPGGSVQIVSGLY